MFARTLVYPALRGANYNSRLSTGIQRGKTEESMGLKELSCVRSETQKKADWGNPGTLKLSSTEEGEGVGIGGKRF